MQVNIPKGFDSEKKKNIAKGFFISKGHYSEKFYLEELLFRRSFCPEGLLFRIQNNDFEIKIFGIMAKYIGIKIFRNMTLQNIELSPLRLYSIGL